jgi:hypothetical protein
MAWMERTSVSTALSSAGVKTVQAVREGHALVSPGLPFGRPSVPPSAHRLIGLA